MSTPLSLPAGLSAADAEAAVAHFLAEHPDFFGRHLELLATLSVPHPVGGGATSLVERQLGLLREQNAALRTRLAELVEVARGNDRLAARMQALALALIEARSLDEVLTVVPATLRDEFSADACCLRLAATATVAPPAGGVFIGATQFARYQHAIDGVRPVCGPLDEALARDLFDTLPVASAALLPLRGGGWNGLLAIGSRDAARFGPGLGTLFLSRIAALVVQALEPHLGPLQA